MKVFLSRKKFLLLLLSVGQKLSWIIIYILYGTPSRIIFCQMRVLMLLSVLTLTFGLGLGEYYTSEQLCSGMSLTYVCQWERCVPITR